MPRAVVITASERGLLGRGDVTRRMLEKVSSAFFIGDSICICLTYPLQGEPSV